FKREAIQSAFVHVSPPLSSSGRALTCPSMLSASFYRDKQKRQQQLYGPRSNCCAHLPRFYCYSISYPLTGFPAQLAHGNINSANIINEFQTQTGFPGQLADRDRVDRGYVCGISNPHGLPRPVSPV